MVNLSWLLGRWGTSALILTLITGCGQSEFASSNPDEATLSAEALRSKPNRNRTPTPSTSATPKPSATPSPSPSVTPSPSATVSPLPSASPSPSPSATPAPSVTPSPSATPAPSVSPSQALIDMVNSQTATSHEAKIPDIRYEWQKYPMIIMQSPSGADIPSWFEYTKPAWCYTLNSWHQVFEAEGNKATNSRVQFRNLKIYVLSEATRT